MKDITFFKALLLKEMNEATFTKKYNDSPKLKGGQKNLPDEVQAKIVKEDGSSDYEQGYNDGKEDCRHNMTRDTIPFVRKKREDAIENKSDSYIQGYDAGYEDCRHRISGEKRSDVFESEVSKDIQSQKMTEADRFTKTMRNIMWDKDWSPKDYANQIKGLSDETLKSWYESSKKNKGIPNSPLAFQQKLVSIEMKKRGLSESEDHEVSMAHNSLKSIVSSASQLMNLLGQEEKNIPAWIQDHITNAENYINQAAKNYHDYSHEQEPEDGEMSLQAMMEDLLEAKKKPSAGLTKKQKSAIVKKAKAGKDIGKKGKGFEKVMKAAEKGGAENPQAVAAAAMWKSAAKKAK